MDVDDGGWWTARVAFVVDLAISVPPRAWDGLRVSLLGMSTVATMACCFYASPCSFSALVAGNCCQPWNPTRLSFV